MKRRGIAGRLVGVAVSAGVAASPLAAAPAPEADCYDSLVLATIHRQTPTPIPNCGDDCIVMRWPWIVELDVERVVRGKLVPSRLTVLTVQHSNYRTDLGAWRWRLRRNTLGGFNVIGFKVPGFEDRARLPRCPKGTPPAEPFIEPGEGRTLGDLLRESREQYRN